MLGSFTFQFHSALSAQPHPLAHSLHLREWVSVWASIFAVVVGVFFSPAFQLNRRKWIDSVYSIYVRCKQIRHYFHVYTPAITITATTLTSWNKTRNQRRKKAISKRHGFRKFLTFCGGYSMLLTCTTHYTLVHLSQISHTNTDPLHYFTILQVRRWRQRKYCIYHTPMAPFFCSIEHSPKCTIYTYKYS